MSTRGCVAVGTPKRWRGVYNHFDSYCSGLGVELYEHLMRRMLEGKTLAAICDDILKFDDWRNYMKGGVCEYCGKIAGQAHTINLSICGKQLGPNEYPDPDAKHHQHNSLDAASEQITSEHSDPLFLEWVYVIDPKAEVIYVLKHESCKLTKLRNATEVKLREQGAIRLSGGRFHYGHCVFRHVHVATVKMSEKPDWEKIECGELYERCHHVVSHHFPELEGTPSGRIATTDYLGSKPLSDLDDACAFIVNGKYATKGSRGYSGGNNRFGVPGTLDKVWYQEVVFADGTKCDAPVAYSERKGYTPYKSVVWVFPPTLTTGYSSRPVIAADVLANALQECSAQR